MFKRERRQTQRVSVQAPCKLMRQHGSAPDTVCENLSSGGAALLAQVTVLQGESVELEASFLQTAMPLPCRVTYVIALTHPPGNFRIGLEFHQLTRAQQAAIDSYLASHTRAVS